jgi:hypothetical protein
MNDVKSTGEASSPLKKPPALQNYKFFHFFVARSCPPGSRLVSAFPMQIRIMPTKINADPDEFIHLNEREHLVSSCAPGMETLVRSSCYISLLFLRSGKNTTKCLRKKIIFL